MVLWEQSNKPDLYVNVGPHLGLAQPGLCNDVLCNRFSFPGGSDGKDSSAGGLALIPGSGRSPGGGQAITS